MINAIRDTVYRLVSRDTTGHDFYHAERTYKAAMSIAKREKCDTLVLGAACYLHDIFRPKELENGILDWHCGPEALQKIEKMLRALNFPEHK
jgi:HD superfamily phosphodiesterase